MNQRDILGNTGRRLPAHGVHPTSDGPTIVWCTVRARERCAAWCNQSEVMALLHDIWTNESTIWRVGRYLIMPDHIHFFAAPASHPFGDIEGWTKFWKSRFSNRCDQPEWRWQTGLFHHRLRSEDQYHEQLSYLSLNPVRAGLTTTAEDWPWRGEVHPIRWSR